MKITETLATRGYALINSVDPTRKLRTRGFDLINDRNGDAGRDVQVGRARHRLDSQEPTTALKQQFDSGERVVEVVVRLGVGGSVVVNVDRHDDTVAAGGKA